MLEWSGLLGHHDDEPVAGYDSIDGKLRVWFGGDDSCLPDTAWFFDVDEAKAWADAKARDYFAKEAKAEEPDEPAGLVWFNTADGVVSGFVGRSLYARITHSDRWHCWVWQGTNRLGFETLCDTFENAKAWCVAMIRGLDAETDDKLKIHAEHGDVISHPAHYTHGEYEPINVIRDWRLSYNLGNALKYIARADHKFAAVQDLRKAIQYLEFEIAFREAGK